MLHFNGHAWLRDAARNLFKSTGRKQRPGSQRLMPRLETLEERFAPAVFNVNSLADILNPSAGVVTLRSAIQAANSTAGSNTINLTVAGTYKITIAGAGEDNNATGDFDVIPNPASTPGSTLKIQNTSGGTVVVDGNHLDRVFDVNPGDTNSPATKLVVTMQGFTIQNGDVTDAATPDGIAASGGGIRDQGNTDLTLTNMVITNNNATADGGGVVMANTINSSWTLTVNSGTISNNHAGDAGGGIDTDGTGTVVINGATINGNTDLHQGAGVYIDAIQVGAVFMGATMNMTGSVVSNNQALAADVTASGGGISNAGNGTMTIANSTIESNFSGGQGGGFSDENNQGDLVVSNSIFRNNSAISDGGGIQEGGPSTTISNTEITGNSSGGTGGGLFANGTTLSVSASTFAGNTAVGGGGAIEIQTTGASANISSITNTTIANNSAVNNAGANGGGIDAPAGFTGSLNLVNDTVNGNFATNGGGIFWAGAIGSIFNLQNTIVAQNQAVTGLDANNPAGAFTDSGGNLIGISGAGSGNTGFVAVTTQTGTVGTPLDPKLGPIGDYRGPTIGAPGTTLILETESLLSGSPAIDAAVTAGAPTVDERGVTRPDGGSTQEPPPPLGVNKPDSGAFEGIPGFAYDVITKVLTLTGTKFRFAQLTTADAAGLHTLYSFTLDGATQTYEDSELSKVVVNGNSAAAQAILVTSDTYIGTDGKTHETVEAIQSRPGGGFVGNSTGPDFLTLNSFPTTYAYVGRADSAQLTGTLGNTIKNTFVTAGSYAYEVQAGSNEFHLISGATAVYGYAVNPTDQAWHYDAAGSLDSFVASGNAYSYMSGSVASGNTFFNEAIGFQVTYGISTHGHAIAYLIDSPGNDTFVGNTTVSYLSGSDSAGAVFNVAEGFALVYAESIMGGTDFAYNRDPSHNILSGRWIVLA